MPRLSEDQMAERARGLGASDMATVAGVNPYASAFELYLEKIGELIPEEPDEAARDRMERGHRLEDVALEWDRDRRGLAFERVNRTIWHPRLPFMFAHPDARRKPWKLTRQLIEVKTTNQKWREVPRRVEVQVQAQMACTGATSCEVLVLGFDGPPAVFLIERDDELIAALEAAAAAFWDRVQRRDPPPIDGSAGASRWLDRKWREEPERQASSEEAELIASYLRAKSSISELSAEVDRIGNILKFGAEGNRLYAPGVGRVIWMAPVTATTVKWKAVLETIKPLVDEQSLAEAIEQETTVTERAGWLKVTAE
jgi:putative phage-type endonuclease